MKLDQILRKLDNQGIKPCGSRVIGNCTHQSDWDFVVTDSMFVREFLMGLGMTPMGNYKPEQNYVYAGGFAHIVFQCVGNDGVVQVACVHDASMKLRITEALKQNKELRELDASLKGRRERNALWDALYAIAGFTKLLPSEAKKIHPQPAEEAADASNNHAADDIENGLNIFR